MPLDAVTVSALTCELREKTVGGRIDRVQQPERDMLLLSLRAGGGNLRLVIAAGTGNARIHLTSGGFENPAEPPMFCMLMRKHLVGARILSVEQPAFERMVVLTLDTHDELGVSAEKKLVVELIGRSANAILVGADGRIIDCMRRMDFAGDAMRRLLPGMIYRLPPAQAKRAFFSVTDDERRAMIAAADKDTPVDKWLMDSFSGLSPLIARELAYRCGGDYEMLPDCAAALAESVAAGELEPWMISIDGKPRDFSFMPIRQYGASAALERFDSFSALLDAFYLSRDRAEQQRRRSHELTKTVRTLRDRLSRKLAAQREELARTEGREDVRRRAELITANIYRIRRGDRTLECEDYYEPGCPQVKIELDPLKTPQQNATALYKEYNKLKTAEQHLTGLIADGERSLDYLNSVLDELERVETDRDVSDIRRELLDTGYIRRGKGGKPERVRAQAPYKFVTDDGFEVLVGRSNAQNDELTCRLARRTDLWLHTQRVHGSHVIIRCEGEDVPPRTLQQAASLAAYYSQGRTAGKIPVDYTMVRNVRKPSGALPGKVIYTEYKTILAEADEELVKRLKNNA